MRTCVACWRTDLLTSHLSALSKQMLVELESKAENLRDLLEELMDDEEELAELNLSSRPKRGAGLISTRLERKGGRMRRG